MKNTTCHSLEVCKITFKVMGIITRSSLRTIVRIIPKSYDFFRVSLFKFDKKHFLFSVRLLKECRRLGLATFRI